MKSYKITFEYLLSSDTQIQYFDELIDRVEFYDLHEKVNYIARTWYIDNGNDITKYKGISIGDVLSLENRYARINLIVFIAMLLSTKPLELQIYKTKEYKIDQDYIDILKAFSIPYEVKIVNESCIQELIAVNDSIHEDKLRLFVRKSITFVNNFLKSFSNKEKIYFQGYSNTLKLIKFFDNKYVIDQFPRSFKDIFSFNKPIYYIPKAYISKENDLELKLDYYTSIDDVLKKVYHHYYEQNKNEIKYMIDDIIKHFKKFNITKAIIMTPEARMPSIIKQYLKQVGGKTALFNHGVIGYTNQEKDLDGIEYILSWSEYESSVYKKLGKEIIKSGYPVFHEMEITTQKEKSKNIEDSIVSILALVSNELYERTRKEVISLHRNLIEMLLTIGYKKKNIKFIMHPGRANREFYLKIYGDLVLENNIIQGQSIIDIINSSDIIIGGLSTVIYETVFLNNNYYTYETIEFKLKNTETIFHDSSINVAYTLDELKENLLNNRSVDKEKFKAKMLYKSNYEDVKNIIEEQF